MSQYPALPKGTYDPGWNDPPKFENNPTAPLLTKPKLSLNKRIAFPMQSESAQSTTSSTGKVETSSAGLPLPFARVQNQLENKPTSSSVQSIDTAPPQLPFIPQPPPPLLSAIPSPSSSLPKSSELSDKESDHGMNVHSQEAIDFVHQIFSGVITALQDDPMKTDVIQKRINMLVEMWTNDNLSDSVKDQLIQIAKALENNEPSKANELHRSLVMNNASVCFHWGSALRQIILMKEQSTHKSSSQHTVATHDIYSGYLIPGAESSTNEQTTASDTPKKSTGRIHHL